MAQVSGSVVALRIGGDDLDPEKITEMLGCAPTKKQTKGQVIKSKSGSERIVKTGMWLLSASDCKPENIDGKIYEIFSKLTDNTAIWKSISDQYKLDLFCGLFMNEGNEGLSISSESLKVLGLRDIELGFDIYGPIEEE